MCPVEYRPDGSLTLIAGASRTGKTVKAIQEVRGASPLLVWDPEGQWSAMGQARAVSLRELLAITRTGPAGRLAYVAPPSPAEFETFCSIAWAWARLRPCTMVVEELADVTNPGKAPPSWGVLLRRGLKYGTRIVAVTNAPAESDKTVIRNAGRVLCFCMQRAQDRAYMARELDAPLDQIERLQVLQFLEKRRGEALRTGRVTPPKLRKSASAHPR